MAMPIIRDLRYVTEDGKVRLRREYEKDVVEPALEKIEQFFALKAQAKRECDTDERG